MNIVRLIGVALAVSLLVGPAFGQEAITLAPAAEQAQAAWPYRTAELHVQADDLPGDVRAVRLRWRAGGPTFVHPVTVVPGEPLRLSVSLPAIQVQQVYNVDLLSGDGRDADVLRQVRATIVWPTELVNPEDFIDPAAYSPYDGRLPNWPQRTRLAVLLSAIVFCAAMASVTFIRRRRMQVVILLAAVIVAAATTGIWLYRQPAVVASQSADGNFMVVTTRRTAEWHSPERLAPVYFNPFEVLEDQMVVRPDGVTLTLRPQRVVLLRRQGGQGR